MSQKIIKNINTFLTVSIILEIMFTVTYIKHSEICLTNCRDIF